MSACSSLWWPPGIPWWHFSISACTGDHINCRVMACGLKDFDNRLYKRLTKQRLSEYALYCMQIFFLALYKCNDQSINQSIN
jgi:hypothetical protein